jgi:hypothetical protein
MEMRYERRGREGGKDAKGHGDGKGLMSGKK